MKLTFLESHEFTAWAGHYLPDDDLATLQGEPMVDPDAGTVMPGCGGLRKLRIADPRRGKGRRGGIRVIYLHVESADLIHLVTIYSKDQKDGLSPEDKKLYRRLAAYLKL